MNVGVQSGEMTPIGSHDVSYKTIQTTTGKKYSSEHDPYIEAHCIASSRLRTRRMHGHPLPLPPLQQTYKYSTSVTSKRELCTVRTRRKAPGRSVKIEEEEEVKKERVQKDRGYGS